MSTTDSGTAAPVPTVRARALLMGFRCLRATWDHAGNADGWGDEIYMTGAFSWVGRDGAVKDGPRGVRTPVYGQRRDQGFLGPVFTKWPQRIELGHANRFGGVRDGDFGGSSIPPWDTHQVWNWPGSAPETPLPVVLWEWAGPADQLDGSIVVSPTIWEGDWGQPLDPAWGDAAVRTVAEVAGTIGKAGGTIAPFAGPYAGLVVTLGGVLSAVGAAAGPVFASAKGVVGLSGDRPVGQQAEGSVRTFDPPVVTIDLARAAEAATRQNGFGPGIYVCPVQDSDNIGGGRYEAFVAFTFEVV